MNSIFPYVGNFIIPTDELIFFKGVGSTTNQDNDEIRFKIRYEKILR